MHLNNFIKLLISLIMTQSAGFVGSLFTTPVIDTWYVGLTKPAFNPPNWVFGPVWSVLYILMGISFFLVWEKHSNIMQNVRMWWKGEDKQFVFTVFFAQLILNVTWSIVFFGFQSLELALINIIVLLFTIVWTIGEFYKISRLAAYLLIPYFTWVSFATYLNYAIWVLN